MDTTFTTTWETAVGETLVCVRELRNAYDRGMRNQQQCVCILLRWPSVEQTASA